MVISLGLNEGMYRERCAGRRRRKRAVSEEAWAQRIGMIGLQIGVAKQIDIWKVA